MRLLGSAVLFVAAVSMAMASDVQGTWSSEREVGDSDGKTYKHVSVITLKEESGVLTGSVVATSEAPWMRENTGKAVDIQDGKVDGNKFTFKLVQEASNGVRTAAYEGTVTGDQMKGVIKFRGIGQSWVFDAKRIEPASR